MNEPRPPTDEEWDATPQAVKDFFLATVARLEDTIQKQQVIIEQQQKQLDTMRAKSLLAIARLQDLGYMQERDRKREREQSIMLELGKEPAADASEQSATDGDGVIPLEEKAPAQNLSDVIKRIFSDD